MVDVEFLMLGPLLLQVRGGRPYESLDPPQERALAALLLDAGRSVPVDRLAAALWTDEPPRPGARQVRQVMSGLCNALDAAGVHQGLIQCDGDAYRLVANECQLDALEFDATLAAAGAQADDSRSRITLLRQALALWRGPALAGLDAPALTPAVTELNERRLSTWEQVLGMELATGQNAGLVTELTDFSADHPLRERPAQLLMLALHRQGRSAEALDVYRRTRRHLLTELGTEPGPALSHAHGLVLRGRAEAGGTGRAPRPGGARTAAPPVVHSARTVRPAQLPSAPAPDFVGRYAPLVWLEALATSGAGPVAVTGPAGMGKSALVVEWALRARDRFPDGHLFADLAGTATATVTPLQVLRRFLPALGLPHGQVPADLDEAAALYRSLLDGRRMLIVLDNASHSDQVRPLLPGSVDCATVVTSRRPLAGLIATHDAHPLTIGPLSDREARHLLANRVGRDRVRADPDATAEIVQYCAGLPSTLVTVAAWIAVHPQVDLSILASELRRVSPSAVLNAMSTRCRCVEAG